jgi:hypothetical protein
MLFKLFMNSAAGFETFVALFRRTLQQFISICALGRPFHEFVNGQGRGQFGRTTFCNDGIGDHNIRCPNSEQSKTLHAKTLCIEHLARNI